MEIINLDRGIWKCIFYTDSGLWQLPQTRHVATSQLGGQVLQERMKESGMSPSACGWCFIAVWKHLIWFHGIYSWLMGSIAGLYIYIYLHSIYTARLSVGILRDISNERTGLYTNKHHKR